MKVGIDAKWFFRGNPSGKIVITNLLKELIHNFPKDQFYVFLDKRDKVFEFPFKANNVKIIYVWGRINLLSNVLIIPIVARKYNIDVFMFQYFPPFISNFKRIAFIHDVIIKSNPEYFTLWERLYFLPLKALTKRAHAVCTVSQNERKRLIKLSYSDQKNIYVINNAVSDSFDSRANLNLNKINKVIEEYQLPEKYLLYVGRLNQRKNIETLLKAINYLKNKEIKLICAGKIDWKMFDIKSKIIELGIKNRVILTGFIEDEKLPYLYSLSTVFCYISLDEGFGLPPLEAMKSGVPTVVAKSGSLPEICGPAGSYVSPYDEIQVANVIDELLTNHQLYIQKQELGLLQAKKYSWEKSAKELHNVFTKLMQ